MEKVILKSKVLSDDITKKVSAASDFQWTGENEFEVPMFEMPKDFGIGLIVGPSGSGKSSILKQLGREEEVFNWDENRAICSHFSCFEEASERFSAVALNSIPDQLKPFHTLSTGQKFRATLARALKSGATIDEFTSVVDRNVAKACSNSIRKYVDRQQLKNIIFVGCHYDVIEYLQPDWIYDTKTKSLSVGRLASRPQLTLSIRKASKDSWEIFKEHHYLTAELPNNTPHAYLYYWENQLVGFGSLNTFPHPLLKSCWNIGRVVVLPDFQGLGFGYKIIENLAQIATGNFNYPVGHWGRCKIVTAIPALQKKLESSKEWEFIKGSDVRKEQKVEVRADGKVFGGYDQSYYDKHMNRPTKAYHYVGQKGFKDLTNIVNDKIMETIPFTDAKGRQNHKLTGNIIDDIAPQITGTTKYQNLSNQGV